MRVAQINGGIFGSTGKIMFGIAAVSKTRGIETFCAAPITKTNRCRQYDDVYYRIGSYHTRRLSVLLDRVTANQGAFSIFSTKKLIKKMNDFSPDIIHLHNIHGGFINFNLLFKYIKKKNVKVIWTFHDCWPFTGHCPHFQISKCEKWKSGCYCCEWYRSYPKTYFDDSKKMWKKKKKWFSDIDNLTIVTPSMWLKNMVNESFFSDYPVKVINNGIDLSLFKPIESSFRSINNCEDKFVVLGVSFGWNARKGLDVFIKLAQTLPKQCQVVLVGTDSEVDKLLPRNVISIHSTNDQKELAEIYSIADVFVNPTREDTYPTVNIEALACGTPVLTFETGGSPEIIDYTCGGVVKCDDIEALASEIVRIYETRPYTREACLERAKAFDMKERFKEYVNLYEDIAHIAERTI